jgi:hypothetical protein
MKVFLGYVSSIVVDFCGRTATRTVEKDKLDFARVLIATESLDVVKREEKLLVDDLVVEVQVIEE